MQVTLPISRVSVSVPAWCVAVALLWPVMFFSFMLHSFAIGGDAFNGKVENGRYFLRRNSQSKAPYREVSEVRYKANYVHALATMILLVPAGIGICRIVWPAVKQIRSDDSGRKSQWCLVGNIVNERRAGNDGYEVKRGTKHFSPGTKIYAFPAQWGDGYEKIIVVGRHRGSKDFVTMVIKADWVTNWRAKVVYNPEVLRRLQEGVCRFWEPHNWRSEREVRTYLKSLQDYEKRDRN